MGIESTKGLNTDSALLDNYYTIEEISNETAVTSDSMISRQRLITESGLDATVVVRNGRVSVNYVVRSFGRLSIYMARVTRNGPEIWPPM